MPVFLTATCEFSRFDDPKRISAGEHVFLIQWRRNSLFHHNTSNLCRGNAALNKNFFKFTLKETNGKHFRMGDIIRLSKNANGTNDKYPKIRFARRSCIKFCFS